LSGGGDAAVLSRLRERMIGVKGATLLGAGLAHLGDGTQQVGVVADLLGRTTTSL
jgi:hypothetical protein